MRLKNKVIYTVATQLRRLGVDFNEQNDPRVIAMKKEIVKVGGKIEFKTEQYPDGSWTAESTNIDGIITGGTSLNDRVAIQKDAIFTYFGIPPHLCVDTLLREGTEPVTVKQQVYV